MPDTIPLDFTSTLLIEEVIPPCEAWRGFTTEERCSHPAEYIVWMRKEGGGLCPKCEFHGKEVCVGHLACQDHMISWRRVAITRETGVPAEVKKVERL